MRAVGAKPVRFHDFTLALGAGGMQVAFAIWAEVEARTDSFSALRAEIRHRLSHQEIDHEAEKTPRRHQDDYE
jgi:hypothetical protein